MKTQGSPVSAEGARRCKHDLLHVALTYQVMQGCLPAQSRPIVTVQCPGRTECRLEKEHLSIKGRPLQKLFGSVEKTEAPLHCVEP
jgi:hypothetical protein